MSVWSGISFLAVTCRRRLGPDRMCLATFEQLLAFGATFSNFRNLEQLYIGMSNKNHKN